MQEIEGVNIKGKETEKMRYAMICVCEMLG